MSERSLENAIGFAARAHAGQVYRGYGVYPDTPYILHPLRVMLSVPSVCQIVDPPDLLRKRYEWARDHLQSTILARVTGIEQEKAK